MTHDLQAFAQHFASRPDIARRAADIRFNDGCWMWPSKSYIKVGPRKARRFVHRISLEIKLGGASLGELVARHSCDNPPCVNPAHLEAGTQADNLRDMAERGRARNKVVWGIDNNKATLTAEEIAAALRRLAAGATLAAVAADCGVTPRAVAQWRDGKARREALALLEDAS